MRSLSEGRGVRGQRSVQKGRIAHLAERESKGPEHLRTTAKCPWQHRELTCGTGDRVPADRLPDGSENEFAGLGEVAAEDHPTRVEQVAEIRNTASDVTADIGDHPPTTRIALPSQPDDAFHGQVRAMAGLQQRQHIARRREGLQATPIATAADGAGFIKSNMPDFACRAAGPAVDLAVDHQPGADTARDLDVRQVLDPAPTAPDQLAERAQV